MPKTLDSWLIPAKAAAPGGSSEQSLDPVQAPATAAAPQGNINVPSVAAPAALLATPEAPLRGSVIAFAGWKGAEDELADLRNEILSAGGRLETSAAGHPGADPPTHLLLGPSTQPDEEGPMTTRMREEGVPVVDAAWVTQQCALAVVPGAGTAEGSLADASGEETEEEEPRLDDDAAAQVEFEADFASTVPTPSSLPADYDDRWDRSHVRLPCSPRARCADGTTAPEAAR